jgi:hypothetical protein
MHFWVLINPFAIMRFLGAGWHGLISAHLLIELLAGCAGRH